MVQILVDINIIKFHLQAFFRQKYPNLYHLNSFYSRGSTKMFPSEISYHKFNNFKSILWLLGGAVQNICPFYMWEGPPFCPQSFGISKKMCKIWSNKDGHIFSYLCTKIRNSFQYVIEQPKILLVICLIFQ